MHSICDDCNAKFSIKRLMRAAAILSSSHARSRTLYGFRGREDSCYVISGVGGEAISFSGGSMAKPRVVPSDLFPLVFGFLRENHFEGAARAFGKAAGVVRRCPFVDAAVAWPARVGVHECLRRSPVTLWLRCGHRAGFRGLLRSRFLKGGGEC